MNQQSERDGYADSEGDQVYEIVPVELEMIQLKATVQQQAVKMDAFMKSQQELNQQLLETNRRLLDALERNPPRGTTPLGVAVPDVTSGESVPSRAVVPNPGPSSLPSIPSSSVATTSGANTDWKEIATSLARRASVGSAVQKPFFASGKNHPIVFLERFERYFKLCRFGPEEKLEVVRGCLGPRVLEWMLIREGQWESFEDFRKDFLGYYWSGAYQHSERMRLLLKRYHPDKGLSMSEYFISQITSLRAASPLVPEVVLVEDVIRQYPQWVVSLWTTSPDKDLKGTLEFLAGQEANCVKRLRPFSEPTPAPATQRRRLEWPDDQQAEPGSSGRQSGNFQGGR
uniref:Retrotransposon gag domain-containing protein n=1 Tax=Photinus pyralis TaxID=7054 RepID=A0A1Y1KQF6_PHOPY